MNILKEDKESRIVYFTDICPFTAINKKTEIGSNLLFNSIKISEEEVLGLIINKNIIRVMYITRKELVNVLSSRWNLPIQQFENSYSLNPLKEKIEMIYIKTNNIKKGQDLQEIIIDFWDVIII